MAKKYTAEDLEKAMDLVYQGVSYKEAGEQYNVPKTTLFKKCHEEIPKTLSSNPKNQEEILPSYRNYGGKWRRVEIYDNLAGS